MAETVEAVLLELEGHGCYLWPVADGDPPVAIPELAVRMGSLGRKMERPDGPARTVFYRKEPYGKAWLKAPDGETG